VATAPDSAAGRLQAGLVLVDLDGTLIHTAPDLAAAANSMLRELGFAERPQPEVEGYIGNGVSRLVKRMLTGEMDGEPAADLHRRGMDIFARRYAACVAESSRPYPGVREGLEQLRAAGFTLACITNKAAAFTAPLLAALALDGYFALVVSGDTLARKKPDPMPLLHCCEQLGVAPARTVLVGDSINDVQAANAAGMPVILVSYGYHGRHDVRALGAARVIDSLVELADCLTLYS